MRDFTKGDVGAHVLQLSAFIALTAFFQTLYLVVDMYFVGRLGKEAVAGVAVAGNLTFIVLAVSQMIGVGTTTLVSHAAGRKDPQHAALVFNQSLVLSVLVGAVFYAVAMSLRTRYATALCADAATARMAGDYLFWFIPAMALQFTMVGMSAALRGTGNFKPGMIVQTATLVLNMALAPFLIFGWVTHRPLGVAGAALATLISVAAGTVWLALYFRPEKSHLQYTPRDWKPRLDVWRKLLGVGLPAGGEFALMAVYLLIVYSISRPFGAAAQAGFGIGLRILQAGFMPVVALGFAVAPVAGQNFGARQPHRVRNTFKSAVLMSIGVMVLFALLCHVAPDVMIRQFSSDAQVIAVGDEYLRIVSWNFVASGIVFVASSMFQALGNTLPPLLTSFVRIVAVSIPAVLMSRMPGFELRWLWYLTVASVTLQMLMNLLLLRREFRLRLNYEAAPAA